MIVNLNQKCTVVLTQAGVYRLHRIYADLGLSPPKEYNVGDEYTAELWETMNTFGPDMYMGFNGPIETKIIIDP